jgi:hypothetical protein
MTRWNSSTSPKTADAHRPNGAYFGTQRRTLRVSPHPHCVRPLLHMDVSLKGFPLVTNAAGAGMRWSGSTRRGENGIPA